MPLAPPKYFTIEDLASEWKKEGATKERIEHYLKEGMLKASIKFGPSVLVLCYLDENGNENFKDTPVKRGLFVIKDYEKLVWVERPYIGLCSDFANQNEKLIKDDCVYTFYKSYDDREENGYVPLYIKPSDILITSEEVQRFELACLEAEKEQKKQYNFAGAEHKARKNAPITQVIEAFFNEPLASHSKVSFYEYVKSQLANKQAEINGVLFSGLVEKVVTAVRDKGIYMKEPKEGAKSGTEKDYWYSDAAISSRLSRKRGDKDTVK